MFSNAHASGYIRDAGRNACRSACEECLFYFVNPELVCVNKFRLSDGFGRVPIMAESDYWLHHVSPSVSPHGITRLPPDGFA
jgi:hypothetical protein